MTYTRGMKGLITVRSAAAKLGISPRRIQVLCAQGRMKGAKKLGRDWLIPSPPVVTPGSKWSPGKIKLTEEK